MPHRAWSFSVMAPIILLATVFVLLHHAAAPVPPGPHIADLSVLLPPRMTNPVHYRLQGSGSCFSWSWDHHDILLVQPEFNGSSECSTSARLISTASYDGRKETAVYAKDLLTGVVIRCEVFIDMITSIKISHHSVKLDLDGLATLRLRAFDREENEFSSLVGLQFHWQLEPKPIDSTHHLIHVPLKETPLSDCSGFCGDLQTQIDLEDRDIGSDLYVVKGVGIGHEVVTAYLYEPNLEHISDKIVLTVAEAMSLEPPSPLFVTIGAVIQYNLRVIRLTTPHVIQLPSPHHKWSVLNSSIAQIDNAMGIARALNLGSTNIILEDIRVSDHFQISSLHVVVPYKLCLYMIPVINGQRPIKGSELVPSTVAWYMFPGQEYVILMKAFSEGPHEREIYITENNHLMLESTFEYWEISPVAVDLALRYNWQNSRLLKPISQGQGTLTASLIYQSKSSETYKVIEVVQEVTVCAKVKLLNEDEAEFTEAIQLPWILGVHQEAQLKAKGGCIKELEDYKWSSSDDAIVSITSSGGLRARGPGQALVRVSSAVDLFNYDEVAVEVSVPSSMVMLHNFPVEVVVGKELEAAVTFRTPEGALYYKCDAFNDAVRWNVISESETFKVINVTTKLSGSGMPQAYRRVKPPDGPACSWRLFYAYAPGRAVVHATVASELRSSVSLFNGALLKAACTIAAYVPLFIYQAGDGNKFGGYWIDVNRTFTELENADYLGLNDLYLVPGSAMDILAYGGPQQWNGNVEHIEKVEVLGEQDEPVENAVCVELTSRDERLYRVACHSFGNFKIIFSRGNLVGVDHPIPAIEKAELHIICSLPSAILLIANEPANTIGIIDALVHANDGAAKTRSSPAIVANNRTIRVASVGLHANGRPFANSSSLALQWELDGCEGLTHWNDTNSCELCGASWERFLVLHDASGICTVQSTVAGFLESVPSLYRKPFLLFGSPENVLTDAIQLQLVSLLRVIPEFVLLVFHPEAKVNLSVSGGTCFLDAATNNTRVIKVSHLPEGSECSHVMLSAEGLGTALLTVRDLGLYPPAEASALVRVANVDWIKIISEEEVSLMEGAVQSFDILAGTNDGLVFDFSQYMYMNSHVHLEGGILELVSKNDSSINGGWGVIGSSFSVRASEIGIGTICVSLRQQSGFEVVSHYIKVEVYKPLQVHPGYVYLMPGSSYMLTVKGGPKSGAFIEYASNNVDKARVDARSGKFYAVSEGNVTVHAAVYGTGGVLICEAHGKVEIGIPKAMVLNSQSDKLCIDCKMPIFPSFPEGNLFPIYQLCKGYDWMTEDEEVLSFDSGQVSPSHTHKATSTSKRTSGAYFADDTDLQFVNLLIGRSAGKTKVSVSFTCEVVISGTRQAIPYSISKVLSVVANPSLSLGIPITWILPPFYLTSEVLPGPSDLYKHSEVHKHKNNIYTLLKGCGRQDLTQEEPISIEGNRIRTKESNSLACIQVKDRTTERSEIASCVRVTEISQVRAVTGEPLSHLARLAVNTRTELAISYYDDLGYPFHEAHNIIQLEVDTDNANIVSIFSPMIENNTGSAKVILEAKDLGNALVRISVSHDPEKADFILVSVGSQVFPSNPVLHVGQFLKFSVSGENGFVSGQWLSSNESILYINRISGEAHARNEGIAQAIFEGSDSKHQTMVTVLQVDQITLKPPAGTLTNVLFPMKGYKFLVAFSDSLYENKLQSKNVHTEVQYDCRVNPPYIGYCKPQMDHITGESYCLFFPHSPRHLFKSKAITAEDVNSFGGFLYISVTASLKDAPHIEGSADALLVGGFSISGGEQLNLTRKSNKSLVVVTGNTDVEVHWSAKDLLLVKPVRRYGYGIGAVVEYEVSVLGHQPFNDKLLFVLPATGQTAEIDISYEPGGIDIKTGSRIFAWTTLIFTIIVVLISVVIFLFKIDKLETSVVPPSQERPVFSPVTPDHKISSGLQSSSSPSTPQPFVEYVRRTIDQTPYYRGKGRRKFDPQNTY